MDQEMNEEKLEILKILNFLNTRIFSLRFH